MQRRPDVDLYKSEGMSTDDDAPNPIFRSTHYRHVKFALQPIDLLVDIDFGKKNETIIDRHADLISGLCLSLRLPALPAGTWWKNDIGRRIIKKISLNINSQEIEGMSGEFMSLYSEMFTSASKQHGVDALTHRYATLAERKKISMSPNDVIVPIPFSFCLSYGHALPLVALHDSTVTLSLELNKFADCIDGALIDALRLSSPLFIVDYVFIDDDERKKYIENQIDVVFEQVVESTLSSEIDYDPIISSVNRDGEYDFELDINGPLKYVMWTLTENGSGKRITNNIFNENFLLNGSAVVQKGKATNISRFNVFSSYAYSRRMPGSLIHCHNFGLDMSSAEHTGSLNTSSLDEFRFEFKLDTNLLTKSSTLRMFFLKYNVLRFSTGTGTLLF